MALNLGIPTLSATFMSLTNLTSAGQVAGISIIAAGGTLLELILSQIVINMRYFLMSLSLSQKLDSSFTTFRRLIISFGITDEIFVVAASRKHLVSPAYMYGLILLPVIGWTGGTFLGCIAAEILPGAMKAALSIAIYGMFIAIIVPPSRSQKNILAAVILSVAVSCLFRYAPPLQGISVGFVIIVSAVAISLIMARLAPIREVSGATAEEVKS